MSFGGFFEIEGDEDDLDPENFDNPFEFVTALMGRITSESIEKNLKLLSAVWGAKTGRNPRYLFADMIAQTGDDEMWEKILLPKAQEMFNYVAPAKASSEGPVVSAEDADDLRRMFETDETVSGHHRHFTVGSDGQTEEEEPKE